MSLSRLGTIAIVLALAVSVVLSMPATLYSSTVSEEIMEIINKAGGKEEYPDANALILLSAMDITFQEDGTALIYDHGLIKVLTEAGIDSYSEKHLPFYKVYDTLQIITVRVIKQDGSVIDVPEDDIKEISSAMSEWMNIYDPDALEKVVVFKNLEIGDCIEYYYLTDLYHAPMDDQFDGLDIFQLTEPIIRKELIINGPKTLPLRYLTKNGEVSFEKKEADGRIEYRWWAENVEKVITEPAMPALFEVVPTVIFTTIDNWEEVSRWWGDIAGSKMDVSDDLKVEVASLTEGKITRDEKVDAIYHFVAQKIRYMGLGTGKKKGLEPKPASETYETKYGVCRDVATLMVAMLREADVDCDIVLTNVGSRVYTELPGIYFNHAIVAIKNDDGSYTYADPTIENSVDWLPAIEAEQQVLVCNDKGTSLSDTPYCPPEENMGHIKAVSNLSADGLYTSEVNITTDGFYDMALRSFLKNVPPAQVQMIFGYILQGIYPGTMLTGFSTSDPEDLTKALEIDVTYRIPNYPLEAGEFTLLKSPVALGTFELISRSVFASASLPERTYPWKLGFTFGATEEETINLPPGYTLKAVPDDVSKEYGSIEYKMTYQTDSSTELAEGGSQVHYRKQLLLKSKQISPDEYKEFKDALRAGAKSTRGEIIMVKDSEG